MAWLAANAMLRQGKSWSGNERNVAYLNLGATNGAMVDVSAASGLDFADDTRAIGMTDWDHDGDLDLWMTARTAPVVRFVKNDSGGGKGAGWAAFRLTGTRGNRDAIGARIELRVPGKGQPLLRTLKAGDGFLSQDSKWVHFGLGSATEVESLSVRWPGGAVESFSGVVPNRRFRLVEGAGKAAAETFGRNVNLQPGGPAVESTDAARVPFYSRLPFPVIGAEGFGGDKVMLGGVSDSACLVNLWASWCRPCLEELQEFAAQATALAGEGLRLVPLCVDRLGDAPDELAARGIMKRLPGLAPAWADAAAMDKLEAVQRTLIQGNRVLPLPCSFLIDPAGRLVALYKGPVSVAQLRADLSLTKPGSPESRLEAAAPFSGLRRGVPAEIPAIQVALKLFEGGYRDHAKAYLGQLSSIVAAKSPGYESIDAAESDYFLATLLEEEGDTAAAMAAYERVVRERPGYVEAHRNLVRLASQAGDGVKAGAFADALAVHDPAAAVQAHLQMAQAYYRTGRQREAAASLRAVLRLNPGELSAASNLAWILATHPDASVRNGTEALRWSETLVQAGTRRDPRALDTLAAALAETGDFARAAAVCQEGIGLARAAGNARLSSEMQTRLGAYQQNKPWRQKEKSNR